MKNFFCISFLSLSICVISVTAGESEQNNQKFHNCAASFSLLVGPYDYDRLIMTCQEAEKLMHKIEQCDKNNNYQHPRFLRYVQVYDHRNRDSENHIQDGTRFDKITVSEAREIFARMDADK